MKTVPYIYWQSGDFWLGYLRAFPDYWTQGESIEDLEEHLLDLYQDLTCGEIEGVRQVGQLTVA